jgi:hypothetical protein
VSGHLYSIVSLFPLGLALVGCVSNELDTWEGEVAASSMGIVSGTPESVGLLDFLNDAATDFDLLDLDVGLDRRAAGNLISHRNGGDDLFGTTDDDLFSSVREVDAVRWVGPRSIEHMVDFAVHLGFVPTGTDYLGTWDGVDFTVNQADATLDLVNNATEFMLDEDLKLNSRAVDSILEAGQLESVKELADLYYVGKSALKILKGAANSAIDDRN